MGRGFAIALLGIGAMSLSCSRAPYAPAARQANASDHPILAADAGDPSDVSPLAGLEAKFEGLATSLQHWDWLVQRQVEELLGLEPGRHHLAVVMPFGYPAEPPRETEPIELSQVVSIDGFEANALGSR